MPVTDPLATRDRSAEWYDYFFARRGGEVLALITDDLVEEHRTNPNQAIGHHSPTLHEVLNFLRSMPIIGKEFIYAESLYEKYYIGTITERGVAADVDTTTAYDSEEEAMHAVFLKRVERVRTVVEGDVWHDEDQHPWILRPAQRCARRDAVLLCLRR